MTGLGPLNAVLQQMLGPAVGVGVCALPARDENLAPDERSASANMVPARRREFAAGRRAARQAMTELGLPAAPILMGDDRAPIWPEGLVGSIAHSKSIAIAAVARACELRTLGLDIEEAVPLPRELWDTVLTPSEAAWTGAQPHPGLAAKQVFCAKEAVYKAQYPLTGTILSFDEVALAFSPSGFTAQIEGWQLVGTVHTDHAHILSCATLA